MGVHFDKMPVETENIELRSEEVNEILSKPPNWVIRYGISVITASILAILAASWFIKYPDIITARIVITSQAPPAKIIANEDGALNLLVKDNEEVNEGQYLGIIKNEAILRDVVAIQKICSQFRANDIAGAQLGESYSLGTIQREFHEFETSLHQYRNFVDLKYYERQIASIQNRIRHLQNLKSSSHKELVIADKEMSLARENFIMDSVLFADKAASKLKRNQSKARYLSANRSYEQLKSKIVNLDLQIEELKGATQETELNKEREHRSLLVRVENAAAELEYAIKAWEQRFVLTAPMNGNVILNKFWSNHQFTRRGDEVFTVIPHNNSPVGRTELPIEGSGKVELGQRVIVKLDNFPYREYGTIRGIVESKSTVPVNNTYALTVSLPEGLTSSYNKDLGYEQELNGTAEIVTRELRLLERVFNQFRALVDNAT